MPKITTFLTFADRAEEAVKLYTSVFANSRIVSESRAGGALISATFELDGQRYIALNGGPSFSFAQGISLFVSCETQKEIDTYWEKLTAGGGEPGRCGWLKDPFGLSWQIVPSILGSLLGDPDRNKSNRALQAMLQMTKLDIRALEQAHQG
jgi:predicted 3-demethylubiquinone-9 3-methyltransferase (glyoxalase superfamily)